MSWDLREAVAKALWAKEWSASGPIPWDEQPEVDRQYWLESADAAIAIVLERAIGIVADRVDLLSKLEGSFAQERQREAASIAHRLHSLRALATPARLDAVKGEGDA